MSLEAAKAAADLVVEQGVATEVTLAVRVGRGHRCSADQDCSHNLQLRKD